MFAFHAFNLPPATLGSESRAVNKPSGTMLGPALCALAVFRLDLADHAPDSGYVLAGGWGAAGLASRSSADRQWFGDRPRWGQAARQAEEDRAEEDREGRPRP